MMLKKIIKNIILIKRDPMARLVLICSAIGALGSWIRVAALAEYFSIHKALILFSILMVAREMKDIVIGPIVGLILDKKSKKAFIVGSNFLRSLLVFSMCFFSSGSSNDLIILTILVVLTTCCGSFNEIGSIALIPSIVKKKNVDYTFALIGSISTLALIFGPMIGSLILNIQDIKSVFIVDGSLFLIAAILSLFLNNEPTVEKIPVGTTNFFNDLTQGFKYVFKVEKLKTFTLLGMASHGIVGATWILVPAIVSINFGNSSGLASFIFSVIGMGSFLGMTIGGSITIKKSYLFSSVCILIATVNIVSLHTSTILFGKSLLYIMSFSLGFFACLHEANFWKVLNANTPKKVFGRVFSAIDSLVFSAGAIFSAISAQFLQFSLRYTSYFLIASLLFLLLLSLFSNLSQTKKDLVNLT